MLRGLRTLRTTSSSWWWSIQMRSHHRTRTRQVSTSVSSAKQAQISYTLWVATAARNGRRSYLRSWKIVKFSRTAKYYVTRFGRQRGTISKTQKQAKISRIRNMRGSYSLPTKNKSKSSSDAWKRTKIGLQGEQTGEISRKLSYSRLRT